MIKLEEGMSDKQKVFLEYWNNELLDFFNMASHSRNYKNLFKVLERLEKEIELESTLRVDLN